MYYTIIICAGREKFCTPGRYGQGVNGMRLLIAEDEADLAEALAVFFERNQFSVDTVSNGFDAYEYASSGEYDAVVLDVMMPKMGSVQNEDFVV